MMKYDQIISLGGNCTVASNLRRRGLRRYSLPFDWTYITEQRSLLYWCEGLANGFKNLCLRENINFEPLPPNDVHYGRLRVIDRYTGYVFVNHFNVTADFDSEYARVYAILRRRVERLLSILRGDGSCCLVIAPYSYVQIDNSTLKLIHDSLANFNPKKVFHIVYMRFGSDAVNTSSEWLHIFNVIRKENIDDFNAVSSEWSWIDKYRLKDESIFHFAYRQTPFLRYRRQFSLMFFPQFTHFILIHIKKITHKWKLPSQL